MLSKNSDRNWVNIHNNAREVIIILVYNQQTFFFVSNGGNGGNVALEKGSVTNFHDKLGD